VPFSAALFACAVISIVKPRRLTGFQPLIEAGRSWQDALKVER